MTSTDDTHDATDLHRSDDDLELLLVAGGAYAYEPRHAEAWLESDEWVSLEEWR